MNAPLLPLLLLTAIGLTLGEGFFTPAPVQADPRSAFPGRRVGGGTRGECNARMIVHLVPESSVFAPGTPALLALLEGPSPQPQPLEVSFKLQDGATASTKRLLPAGPVGLVLLPAPPLPGPVVWESEYLCSQTTLSDSADLLQVVTSSSPPALSLLIKTPTPADAAISTRLQQLLRRCGGSVSRSELVQGFGLGELLDASWPDQLPVRCPTGTA